MLQGLKASFCLFASTAALFAFSSGPPTQRTGAQVDGGITCNACHRGENPNADLRGRITIEAGSYSPGVRQTIRVLVEHPDAARWGFQLIARAATDETRQAGTFSAGELIRVRCGPAGTDGPCNGDREFASHTAGSTRLGQNGRMVWEVQWTPPVSDIGDVVFYAAGNAANAGNTNAGDLIYTTASVVRNGSGCTLLGRPSISAVTIAGSGAVTLGVNSLATIWGENFSPISRARGTVEAELRGRSFPRQIDCVTVLVNGQPTPLTYVGPRQINFAAPLTEIAGATVQVVANNGLPNDARSNMPLVTISVNEPSLLTFNGSSVAARHADGAPVAASAVAATGRAARPGDTISLFATGLGYTQPVWASGDIARTASPLTSPVTVMIGGITLGAMDVSYSGSAPEAISGLYQLNVRIPAGLGAGDQPVVVTQAGRRSQSGATIPVMP